jgi:acyl-CoA synthetase (AMP-forming)/AMP-acid ligase II
VNALRMVEQNSIAHLGMVGDAFARPLIEELEKGTYDVSSLRVVSSGGAALTPGVKARLAAVLGKSVSIREGMGSSEGGLQGGNTWTGNDEVGVFDPGPLMRLLSADRSRELNRDEREDGWLATLDRVPLGYLNEPALTATTFPSIGGRRYSIPGDRARWRDDGRIKVLGRDSLTINSGGEKVFAEEVEEVIRSDPRIEDVLVVGRPSERWGQEVVALVVPRSDAVIDRETLNAQAAERLARYKLPKQIFVVAALQRTAAGKPDYRWARALVAGAESQEADG